MNLSQAASGGSRNVNVIRDPSILRESLSFPREDSGPNGAPTKSALPWKPVLYARIRAAFRGQRHHVIEALVRLSNSDGQCWVSMETLAHTAQVDVKTARKHVHLLMRAGAFLKAELLTWAQLCANRRAAGRAVPRTENDRTAPYLFTILDGVGRRANELPEVERSQRFGVRPGRPPRRAQGERRPVTLQPQTRDLVKAEGYQPWQASWVPTVVTDSLLDPMDQEKSVHAPPSGACSEQHTFLVSASKGEGGSGGDAWRALLDAYRKHYLRVYQATPTASRRLTPDFPREASEYLTQKGKILASRLSLPQQDAVQLLADRALGIWLDRKGSGGFLERESHPLWALCDELPARVNEACKALVREHVALTTPSKAPEKTEKTAKDAASWEEMDAARREAVEQMGKIFGAPLKPISRPNLQPRPEKLADVSHAEIRVAASRTPDESKTAENKVKEASSDESATSPQRPAAPRPGLPRRVEALPIVQRPESVRSGPRWGEVVHRPVKMRRSWGITAMHEAEPEESVEIFEPEPRE